MIDEEVNRWAEKNSDDLPDDIEDRIAEMDTKIDEWINKHPKAVDGFKKFVKELPSDIHEAKDKIDADVN